MRLYKILTILAAGPLLAACNEAFVPDFNTSTGFPHSVSALQNEFSGVFTRERLDVGFFNQAMEGFARNAAYYTNSEERFVTQLTGQTQLDDDNFGAGVWNVPFIAVKGADSLIAIVPTLQNNGAPLATADVKGLQGVAETMKALMYMYIALAHDTNGVAMNAPGQPFSGNLAPILCARDSWKEIVAILDTAKADLDAAGSNPLGVNATGGFALVMPPGYSSLGSTASGFEALTLALRGRARLELAYAIARGPGGSAPTATTAGSPDVTQLDSAIADITASSLYSPAVSAGEAIAANDVGVFHSFSSAAGDISNPVFSNASATFVLEQSAKEIDTLHDQRFLAKFGQAPALPTSVGAISASHYAYLNNIGLATPMPIVRNLELQFVLARAYLGTGNYAKAATIVDAVRTTVGGLPSGLGGVNTSSYTSVRDFLVNEMRPSLIEDGTGDEIAAIRDYGLVLLDLNTWATIPGYGNNDFHTSMENIPSVERQQRNNNFAAVCP